ncbi:MAG: GYD domain-containing protein [bacterium]
MATYIMLSRLTEDGAETIRNNPGRIQEVNKELAGMGVQVTQQYAVLGAYDFVNIVEAPDLATIMKASVALGSRGSVHIETLAAVTMDEFVKAVK